MINKFIVFLFFLGSLLLCQNANAASETFLLADRLAGNILLQVEKHGEAWYIHPDTLLRYYMPNGDAAYEIMRYFGLGISETDFAKLEYGDTKLRKRLKGKIVLRVEKNGEAYYIKPQDLSLYYLKNGEEAYKLMREHSLGIKDDDLNKLLIGLLTSRQETLVDGVKEKNNRAMAEQNYLLGFNIWINTKNYVSAEKYYKTALQYDPDYAPALSSYGFIRAAFYDEYELGEKFLNRAMQQDPNWGYAPFNIGLMYDLEQLYYSLSKPGEKTNDWLDARHAYAIRWIEFSVDKFPSHPDINHFKSQLTVMKTF